MIRLFDSSAESARNRSDWHFSRRNNKLEDFEIVPSSTVIFNNLELL